MDLKEGDVELTLDYTYIHTYIHTYYRVFSLTWPASMQIYWNKRKRLHKKGTQLPKD